MQAIDQQDLDLVLGITSRFLPEIILCITIILLLASSLAQSLKSRGIFITLTGLAIHLASFSLYFFEYDYTPRFSAGNIVVIFKVVMAFAAVLTIAMSGKQQRTEFFIFILSALVGAELLSSNSNFIIILLSIELISISSYVLTAGFSSDKQRAEAAWKFFVYGSVATAIMIFGMTYYYGALGENTYTEGLLPTRMASIGVFMISAGFLFKMTAAPLHLWAPDVYEATPSPIVAFLSVVPKLAGLMALAQLKFLSEIGAYLAIFTIIVGTLAAINQKNAKRMMAYSSVAQAGFFLAALYGNPEVWGFYAVVFTIMNYVVFVLIDAQEKNGLTTTFADFTELGYTNTFAAIGVTVGLISLTGLPPTAGFIGKLLIFSSVWGQYIGDNSSVLLALFVVGLLATVASLYFYLKIPFYAFLRRNSEKQPLKIPLFTNLLLLILVGLLLALFMAPSLLMG